MLKYCIKLRNKVAYMVLLQCVIDFSGLIGGDSIRLHEIRILNKYVVVKQ